MNKAKLKSYAPQARKDFIAAVTARANLLGLSSRNGIFEIAVSQPQGDTTVIAGQAWPVKVHSQRQQLIARIEKDGFAQTMEAVAYTWFNRFAALRYMELHDYLGHGHRALSSLKGALPDILTHAADLAESGELPGLKPAMVVEMKLAGNRDGELYRLLLVAQCNALSNVMPFLFERIDDETELLLPDNLLRTDSVIAKLVASIEEDDWKEVEIIGWLYQFYISEKKKEVIGKVVKSEDIPAATQLFTPNWIVQYLVQNSVGRLWLMANPASALKAQWPYYIEPADQTPEVQAQLDALIQTRMDEDGGSLNPESITLLDPACGSGHILVEAYAVLKAIYLERGYQPRAIPRLILEKNLFGLDIDDRAAQMAGFALLMKARFDDRRLFNEPVKLNVLSLKESKGLNANELANALQWVTIGGSRQIAASTTVSVIDDDDLDADLFPGTRAQFGVAESRAVYVVGNPESDPERAVIAALIDTFEHAKTFGSLIQIPPALNVQLASMAELLQLALQSGDLYASAAAQDLMPLLVQARMLGMQFDAVVANPPYMGSKFYGSQLKTFVEATYRRAKGDLYTCFMMRGLVSTKMGGIAGMITIPNWMFLSTYEELRTWLFKEIAIDTFSHNGRGVFGSDFGSCAFTLLRCAPILYKGRYKRLFTKKGSVASNEELDARFPKAKIFEATVDDFKSIPGSPVAYWISNQFLKTFLGPYIGSVAKFKAGISTGDNPRFQRYWHEISSLKINFHCNSVADAGSSKWFPCNSGGTFRKWYGNNEIVVDWENDGAKIRSLTGSAVRNSETYFRSGLTYSKISASRFAARFKDKGFVFDDTGRSVFCENELNIYATLGLLCSEVAHQYLTVMAPTMSFTSTELARIPFLKFDKLNVGENVKFLISASKEDWDENENSWDFASHPFIGKPSPSIEQSWDKYFSNVNLRFAKVKELEEVNNRIFIEAYGLQDELNPEIPEEQITLARADREKDCQRLIFYAIGCMMGRYSLDEPGLIYANAGNIGFDDSRYASFPADFDGIVPLTDELWFEDEAASRIREFLLAVWGADTLAENMAWLAESLGAKAGETPDETIRRYLADKFFKDHLQTYKKRPIYWLFSSGKQGAFQALVYLHRYHEGTLARLRAEYVVPLTGKIQSRIDMLEKDAASAASTAARNKLNKEIEKLKKKHVELLAYDEQLRHHADMRITLDLDDGVKVNYGKFGNLLDSVKIISGASED